MKILLNKFSMLALAGTLLGNITIAQTSTPSNTAFLNNEVATNLVIGFIVLTFFIVLVVLFKVYQILYTVMSKEEEEKAAQAGKNYKPVGLWTSLFASWTKAVPLEEEKSIELDHEYDGIKELDNHLPPWWLALFYGSIVFGVIYIFGYHVAGWWPLQDEEYAAEEAKATEIIQANLGTEGVIDETTITYNDDPAFLGEGKKVFDQICMACHRADGGGSVGPNLTDNYWIHGGDIKDIFATIKNGVPGTSMTSWEKALSAKQIGQVSSFVYSLKGTNPPDPKAPEGVEEGQSNQESVDEKPGQQSADTTEIATEGQN